MANDAENTKTTTKKVTTKTVEKKTGAGPALAAHSKDAASGGTSGQVDKATSTKSTK